MTAYRIVFFQSEILSVLSSELELFLEKMDSQAFLKSRILAVEVKCYIKKIKNQSFQDPVLGGQLLRTLAP